MTFPPTNLDDMKQRRGQRQRRGLALLIVLGCLVVIMPICIGLVHQSAVAHATQALTRHRDLAHNVCHEAESGLITQWLATDSRTVVLPPDATVSSIELAREQWTVPNPIDQLHPYNCELHITAWDQCGMVGLQPALSGSPLRLTLPSAVRRQFSRLERDTALDSPGLDLFFSDVTPEVETSAGTGLCVFPKSRTAWDDDGTTISTAIGAVVATHQPGTHGLINVNTAPIPVVARALELAGRGGLEVIINAREDCRPATVPPPLTPELAETLGATGPELTASSRAWAFRIDVRVGSVRRSWWSVFVQKSSNSRWEQVQRLVIPEA